METDNFIRWLEAYLMKLLIYGYLDTFLFFIFLLPPLVLLQ
jgi:hypothetical protein